MVGGGGGWLAGAGLLGEGGCEVGVENGCWVDEGAHGGDWSGFWVWILCVGFVTVGFWIILLV